MSDEPVIVRQVFTTTTGAVCDRDDPNAAAVEVVWLDANGEEHRTYGDVSGRMTPDESRYWARIINSDVVVLNGNERVFDFRTAIQNGDPLTANQVEVVRVAEAMLGIHFPTKD